jgi:hypothetical protein
MVKPNFFIAGAPKSGTTSLYSYLKQHPYVYLAKKEIYYFCYDLTFRTPPLDESVYMSYFADARLQKAVGDASSYYLLSPGAAQRIKNFNPEAKIIIMLRNPIQMVYSLHSQLFFSGNETIKDFEKALDAEDSRRMGQLVPPYHRCPLEAMFYSSVAKYYEQVSRYKAVFPDNNMHIIFYDDFKANTEAEYRKVLKFLELDEIMPASFSVINPNKEPRSKVLLNFLVKPPGLIKSSGRFLFPHHSKRREWLMDRLWNLNMKFKPRKPLSTELKQRLVNMYKDDIEKLGVLLNRDLSNWLKLENGE